MATFTVKFSMASILNKNDITLTITTIVLKWLSFASILNKNDITLFKEQTHIILEKTKRQSLIRTILHTEDIIAFKYDKNLRQSLIKTILHLENCAIFDDFLLIFIRIIHFLAVFRNIFSTISFYCVVNLYNSNTER